MNRIRQRPRRSFPTKVIDNVFNTFRDIIKNTTGFKMRNIAKKKSQANLPKRNRRFQGGLGYKTETRVVDLYDTISMKLDAEAGQYYYVFSNNNKNFDINESLVSSSEFTKMSAEWILFRIQKLSLELVTAGNPIEITHPGTAQQSDVLTEKVIYPNLLFQTYNAKLTGIIDDGDVVRNPVCWNINPNLNRQWYKVFRLNDPKLIDRAYVGKWFAKSEEDDLPDWSIFMSADNMLPVIEHALGFNESFSVATVHARIYVQGVIEDTVGARATVEHLKPIRTAHPLATPLNKVLLLEAKKKETIDDPDPGKSNSGTQFEDL